MRPSSLLLRLLSALNGALGVAMGAFAAHGATDPHPRELLRTGATYALVHAAAALALETRAPWAALSLTGGGLVFSVSIYALAFGAPPLTGAITPLGGVLMILGWLLAGWSALARRE
jgi:uncharacterized membrane protein YgdD (TMEM256/DUF423 family)